VNQPEVRDLPWPAWVQRHPLIWGCIFGASIATAGGFVVGAPSSSGVLTLILSFILVRSIGRAAGGRGFMGTVSNAQRWKPCPHCVSRIPATAAVCAHCGRDVATPPP
jgi:hypothetical protein